MRLENTIKKGSKILKKHNVDSYILDSEIIISNIMDVKREFLLTNSDIYVGKNIIKKFNNAIKRRMKKEPIAYISGKKEFWSHDFIVNKSTLIPRPETELLIYKIVKFFKGKKINILDIGTGSGCILLAILKELTSSRGIGIDILPQAVKTAKENSRKLHLSCRSKFKVFEISKFNEGKYDLIVSNPPYILSRDIKRLDEGIIRYEPLIALNGGQDGLDLIKKVIYKSTILLKKSGILAIEIGNGQYKGVSSILKRHKFREMHKEYDYKRNIRCIISTKI